MQPAPAAIAAVSAGMAAQSACGESTRRVSVLMINGTDDPIVPFPGGKVGARGHKTGTVVSAAAARDFWLRADGLSQTVGIAYSFPHLSAGDPTQATRVTYGPAGGPQVEVITVRGGGHVEPSRRYHYGWLYRQIVGTQNQDFESAEEAWAFFKDKTSP
jgi:polyhydroxybutyrate depolymerase